MFRAGLPVYVYVWATRLYDFCLIAAANKQAPLVTHIERGGERGRVGGEGVKRLWRSSGKLNLSLEHAKRTPNRPLASAMASIFLFIFIPFANSMEIFCWQISFETHVINLFVQHFATLKQLPQPSCPNPRVQLATCHLFCNIFHS